MPGIPRAAGAPRWVPDTAPQPTVRCWRTLTKDLSYTRRPSPLPGILARWPLARLLDASPHGHAPCEHPRDVAFWPKAVVMQAWRAVRAPWRRLFAGAARHLRPQDAARHTQFPLVLSRVPHLMLSST